MTGMIPELPIRGTDPIAARPFLQQFEEMKADLPGAAFGWVRDLRERAAHGFAALGLPTVRTEAWKYTNLRAAIDRATYVLPRDLPAAGFDVLPSVRPGGAGVRLVFVDGRLNPELSDDDGLPDGVDVAGLGAALAGGDAWLSERLGRLAAIDAHPLAAFNTAFLSDGAVIRIGRDVEIADPIELVYVSLSGDGEAAVFHPRTLVVAEENSRAVIVEHHIGYGAGRTFANHVAEIDVADGATLRHYKVQRERDDAIHLSHAAVRVGRGATYDSFILTTGAALSRNEVNVHLAGEGAHCTLDGAYMVRGRQHCDTTTFIDHAVPHGTSREVYKGVIDANARAVFQGKIRVRPGAQKTDGHQLNRALLLSDHAEIDSKPELEIYADDVKCSHGATAGELDDGQLFYLRARGIPAEEARGLLIGAFLGEAIDTIANDPVRDAFRAVADAWMTEARHG